MVPSQKYKLFLSTCGFALLTFYQRLPSFSVKDDCRDLSNKGKS